MTGRRGAFNREPDRAAEALRMAWGDIYDIGFVDGSWRAARLDGTGALLTGQVPDELAAAIRADWGARSAVNVPARDWLRLAACEEDQIPRLAAFRAAHPEVVIGDQGFGVWQALIPEVNGEMVVTRYTLRELLDKLDRSEASDERDSIG